MFAGRRSTGLRQIGSAMKTATGKRGISKRADLEVDKTAQNVTLIQSQITELDDALEQDLKALNEKMESALAVETARILPLKTGIQIKEFGILWTDA